MEGDLIDAFWLCFVVGHAPLWFLFSLAFYLRRDYPPLKYYRPNVLLTANVGGIGFSLFSSTVCVVSTSMNAYAMASLAATFLSIMFDAYTMLALSLYFAFNKTTIQMAVREADVKQQRNGVATDLMRIRQFAFLLSDAAAYIYIILNILVLNIAMVVYANFYYPEVFGQTVKIAYVQPSFVLLQSFASVKLFSASVIFCLISFRIRLIRDMTGIKQLLKRCGMVSVVTYLQFWIAHQFLQEHLPPNAYFDILTADLGTDVVFAL